MDIVKIIVLTPVKNEAWILKRFLKATSIFADSIIILDQNSTDSTKEIAESFSKVTYLNNENDDYDEEYRQKILISKARELFANEKRLLLALDADEIIAFDSIKSSEWQSLYQLESGTRIFFPKFDILPDLKNYVKPSTDFLLGYLDDGKEHIGKKFHSPRLPESDKSYNVKDIIFLHLALVREKEFRARQRLYCVLENINNSDVLSLRYRKYSKIFQDRQLLSNANLMPKTWLEGHLAYGANFMKFDTSDLNSYNFKILSLFQAHGTSRFWHDDIWDIDYSELARHYNVDLNERMLTPPILIRIKTLALLYSTYLLIVIRDFFKRK